MLGFALVTFRAALGYLLQFAQQLAQVSIVQEVTRVIKRVMIGLYLCIRVMSVAGHPLCVTLSHSHTPHTHTHTLSLCMYVCMLVTGAATGRREKTKTT